MSDHRCTKCGDQFDTKGELKAHMASKIHKALQVVCPFCLHEETLFRRAVDLRTHLRDRHPSTWRKLESNFAGEPNGFWLSTSPQEYSKIVTPTSEESPEAKNAREAVLRWLAVMKRTSKSPKEWKDGWKLSTSTGYSPTEPEIDLAIADITLQPSESTVTLITQGTSSTVWHQAVMASTLFGDTRSRDALLRKMLLVQQTILIEQPSSWGKDLTGSQLDEWRRRVGTFLGVSEAHITTIKRGITKENNDGRGRKRQTTASIAKLKF